MLNGKLLPVSMRHRIFQGFFENKMPLLLGGMAVAYHLIETLSTAISRSPLRAVPDSRELMWSAMKSDAQL